MGPLPNRTRRFRREPAAAFRKRPPLPSLSCLFLLALALIPPLAVQGASVTATTPMSFGTILADPGGDVFEIDASSNVNATPVKISGGWSFVMGGGAGVITIAVQPSDITAGLTIQLRPPGSLMLQSGSDQILLDDIAANSMVLLTPPISGVYNFGIGGTLHLGLNQAPGSYSGTISVTVDFL